MKRAIILEIFGIFLAVLFGLGTGFSGWALVVAQTATLRVLPDSILLSPVIQLNTQVSSTGIDAFGIYTADKAFDNSGEISESQGILTYYFVYDVESAMQRDLITGSWTSIDAALSLINDYSFLSSDNLLRVTLDGVEVEQEYLEYSPDSKTVSFSEAKLQVGTSGSKLFALTYIFGRNLLVNTVFSNGAPQLKLTMETKR